LAKREVRISQGISLTCERGKGSNPTEEAGLDLIGGQSGRNFEADTDQKWIPKRVAKPILRGGGEKDEEEKGENSAGIA